MKYNILSFAAIAVLAMSASCSRENIAQQEEEYQNGPVEVTVTGELGEFAPTAKSTAEACVRMKWAANDVVWAYDRDGGSLGKLTVSTTEGDYIAIMTGTLTSAPSDGKLFLVHSPLMDKDTQPKYGEGLSINMATQSADVTPFVAYAVVEGVTATAQSNFKTKFIFATSVLKVNATGITKDASLTSATISDIETVCKIHFSGGVVISSLSETSGTITKALSGNASLSRASFYVGVPAFSEGTQRVLTVNAGGKDYLARKVMQTAYTANNYINYIYSVKTFDYVDEYGVNRGAGTYIASTGVVWSPVNCGYEPTNHKYGKLYQWGRKYGCGYEGSDAHLIQTTSSEEEATITEVQENPSLFYGGSTSNYDWLSTRNNNRWDSVYGNPESQDQVTPAKTINDPCPAGWRVPTYYELNALLGSHTSGSFQSGTHGITTNLQGKFFNGTTESTPTSGVFLPAAGYRGSIQGLFYCRGYDGSYWSSSVNNYENPNQAWYLNINGTEGSNTGMAYMHRANGHSVRCVQE